MRIVNNQGFIVNAEDNMDGISDMFTNLWDKNKDKLMTAGEDAVVKYAENNSDKLMDIVYGVADKAIGDSASGQEKVQDLVQTAVQTGSAEAQNSLTQMISDNKWLILGGVVLTLGLFGSVGYGVASVAAKKSR